MKEEDNTDLLQQEAQLKTTELGSNEETWPGAPARRRTDWQRKPKETEICFKMALHLGASRGRGKGREG